MSKLLQNTQIRPYYYLAWKSQSVSGFGCVKLTFAIIGWTLVSCVETSEPIPDAGFWLMLPSMGTLGKLKRSKTSKYSSSLIAGVLTPVGLYDLIEVLGWREIKKSRSYAHLKLPH